MRINWIQFTAIFVSDADGYEEYYLLGYDAVQPIDTCKP
jgi:hypothetical protein